MWSYFLAVVSNLCSLVLYGMKLMLFWQRAYLVNAFYILCYKLFLLTWNSNFNSCSPFVIGWGFGVLLFCLFICFLSESIGFIIWEGRVLLWVLNSVSVLYLLNSQYSGGYVIPYPASSLSKLADGSVSSFNWSTTLSKATFLACAKPSFKEEGREYV